MARNSAFGDSGVSAGARYLNPRDQVGSLETLAALAMRGTVSPLVRTTALKIVRECASREDACELETVYNAVKHGDPDVAPLRRGFKYVADSRFADYFTSPEDTLKGCLRGACGGDCLPAETLVLGAGYRPMPIAEVQPGQLVMGDGQWVRVTNKWNKGRQSILEFELRNGGVLRCTPDHRVFVVPKRNGFAGDRREAIEVRASEVRPGDDLLTADRLPFGQESLEADRAFLLGLHVADGWVDYSRTDERPFRVGISGLDGWRKESNKTRVQAFCERNGIETRWAEKYLAINDEGIAEWLAACGRRAPNKHLPSLNWDEATIREVLTGLDADSDVRNGVFSTTSSELALQYRLMLRMLGVSVHLRRVDKHGGLGKNPIYRVTPRWAEGARQSHPHARVVSISEDEPTETFDIEVEGHRFYLPETDLIVHNCDDHSALIAALLGALGWRMGLRAWGRRGEGVYSHVYAVALYPKRPQWRSVIALDTTVPEFGPGDEPPRGDVVTAWLL